MKIEIDNSQDVFFVGQIIAGRIVFEAQDPPAPVSVSLCCYVRTKLSEDQTSSSLVTLLEQPSTTFASDFTFTIQIPKDITAASQLPPSYIHSKGYVFYVISAISTTKASHAVLPITVLPLIDSNSPRFVEQAAYREEDMPGWRSYICCVPCGAFGPITASLCLPRAAWCPGEQVNFQIKISGRVEAIEQAVGDDWAVCSIRQLVKFYSLDPSIPVQMIENTVIRESVPQRDTPAFNRTFEFFVRLPPCCPSFARSASKLIEVTYQAVLTLHSSPKSVDCTAVTKEEVVSGSGDLELRVPLIVSTIPKRINNQSNAQFVSTEGVVNAILRPGSGGCSNNQDASLRRHSVHIQKTPGDPSNYNNDDPAANLPEPVDFDPFMKYAWFPMPHEHLLNNSSNKPTSNSTTTSSTTITTTTKESINEHKHLLSPLLNSAINGVNITPVITSTSGNIVEVAQNNESVAGEGIDCFFCPPGELSQIC